MSRRKTIAPTCRRCRVTMERGIAMTNGVVRFADFPGDTGYEDGCTIAAIGPSAVRPCWKCPECGYSLSGAPLPWSGGERGQREEEAVTATKPTIRWTMRRDYWNGECSGCGGTYSYIKSETYRDYITANHVCERDHFPRARRLSERGERR